MDITSYLKEGTNEISLSILRTNHEKTQLYAIAVEVMDIASLNRIKAMVPKLSVAESRRQIQKRLSSHHDEDLVVMDGCITIDLRDPSTMHVFNIPVRDRSCPHWECFDLHTFLQAVVMTPETGAKKAPYLKCSREDILPTSLVIDEFLVEVRAELERSG
jgi:phosphoribosylpyrophosphate synthetase